MLAREAVTPADVVEPPADGPQPGAEADPESHVPAADSDSDLLPPLAPVVGVGMSAGGLEACSQLLEVLPPRPGFSIVLIQHLSPHHQSALPALLALRAPMRVVEATDGMRVVPDTVFVIPADHLLELADGHLHLAARPTDGGQHHPVDHFLDSLAIVEGDRSLAVILSGTGSDGARGVRSIKQRGGTVLAQLPESAKYDGMPRAAMDTGVVDLVLPPAEIGRKLVELVSYVAAREANPRQPVFTDRHFEEIFDLLRAAVGVDFSHYKQPTIRRRILRRMAIKRIEKLDDYLKALREQPDEVRSLYQDILIHVTRFFREPESSQALAAAVFPTLLRDRRSDNPVRIWVAGCATGEEAYSLAIALIEFAGDDLPDRQIQVFGTDVSDAAIEYARQGVYPASIAEVIPADRLRRFFSKVDSGYRVAKSVRDLCIFARQDLTRDPPFSRLDLVLCRNVLIYMDVTLQRHVIPVFHYALKPDGYLVLGQAETVGTGPELFTLVDKRHKIYRKRQVEYGVGPMSVSSYPLRRTPLRPPGAIVGAATEARAIQNEANRVLLERYGPCGVLVSDDLEIVQFRGHTGAYLEPAPGDASLNILKLAREGLLHGLRSALQTARQTRKPVQKTGLRVRSEDGWKDVNIDVVPLSGAAATHYLVLFEEPRKAGVRAEPQNARRRRADTHPDTSRTAKLEEELGATREYLQSIIQEVEAANEELQSANEEILSSNEELQSTNEELDTAKEELQSTNEELNTLNDEMHARNEELTRVNSDLINLLGSVHIAIVIVGADLKVRRFTPMAEKVLNLIPADIGRPITQVKPNFECPELGDLISEAVDRVGPVEREVRDVNGRWLLLRIRPYKSSENRIDGAVVALIDIDPAKRQERAVAAASRQVETVVQTVLHPLLVLDQARQVHLMNRAFCERFRISPGAGRGRPVADLGGIWAGDEVARLLEDVSGNEAGQELLIELDGAGGRGALRLAAREMPGLEQDGRLVLVALEDVTEREA